jgi:hypothetical protein
VKYLVLFLRRIVECCSIFRAPVVGRMFSKRGEDRCKRLGDEGNSKGKDIIL